MVSPVRDRDVEQELLRRAPSSRCNPECHAGVQQGVCAQRERHVPGRISLEIGMDFKRNSDPLQGCISRGSHGVVRVV